MRVSILRGFVGMMRMADRSYWDMEVEPKFGTEAMRDLQLEGLKRPVGNLFEHAPYHRAPLSLERSDHKTRFIEIAKP